MLTQRGNPDITNVTSPEQVKVSTFYQAGLRINLGRSAQSGRALYEDYSASNVSTAVALANEANLRELNELRASYESRINKLNNELAEAVSRRDTVTVTRVLREKEDLSGRISSVDKSTSELAVAQAQEEAAPAAIAAAIAPLCCSYDDRCTYGHTDHEPVRAACPPCHQRGEQGKQGEEHHPRCLRSHQQQPL